jgi:CBS domain-containing protein
VKVKDVMMRDVKVCVPEDNLAAAAMIMWQNDCGVVPVMREDCEVLGVITDRDICMAVATKHRSASEITVGEVYSGNLYACNSHDDVHDALKTMKAEKVRRLPVISANGTLEGMLSMNDIVRVAEPGKGRDGADVSYEDVVKTLKAISAPRGRPAQHAPF